MKYLVNLVQLMVIGAIIYPMFYIWDTDKVDQFCKVVKQGVSKEDVMQMADDKNVKILGLDSGTINPESWQASVDVHSPFTQYSCVLKGFGGQVVDIWITEEEDEEE